MSMVYNFFCSFVVNKNVVSFVYSKFKIFIKILSDNSKKFQLKIPDQSKFQNIKFQPSIGFILFKMIRTVLKNNKLIGVN